jgi:hypothetical protein
MILESDFAKFLQEIRLQENHREDLQTGHRTLRERLRADEDLKPVIVSDFLQGSYRRDTAVRPNGDARADVDIVVVTNLKEHRAAGDGGYTPAQAINRFKPFVEKYYKGKYRIQGRSIGIELSYVELDLVITSAPSEAQARFLASEAVTTNFNLADAPDWRLHPAWLSPDKRTKAVLGRLYEAEREEEWKAEPLRIPDRDANIWEDTHPLEQIRWTRNKNANCEKHFVNVVKAIKWWRLEKHPEPERPKGFPLERLVGECCPDGIRSVAQGIALTLAAISANYAGHVATGRKPVLPDYGVPGHDVFKRVTAKDFAAFHKQAVEGAALARRAYESINPTESGNLWHELLGDKFPKPSDNGGKKSGGFTERAAVTIPGSTRFA